MFSYHSALGQTPDESVKGFVVVVQVKDVNYQGESLLYIDAKDIDGTPFEGRLFPADTTDLVTYFACCKKGDMEKGLQEFLQGDGTSLSGHGVTLNTTFIRKNADFSFEYSIKKQRFYSIKIWSVLAKYCKCKSRYSSFREMSYPTSQIILLREITLDSIKTNSNYKILSSFLWIRRFTIV